MDQRLPSPPTALDTDDWELYEQSSGAVFSLPTAEVNEHTRVYEDAGLRAAISEATDGALDRVWRFCFVTRLTVSPPPPPGVGTAAWYPTVAAEARNGFADDLRDRGFENVERHRGQRMRTASGTRARLTKFTADSPIERDGDEVALPTEGWLAVWAEGREFRLAGGAYPTSFGDALTDDERTSLGVDPSSYRDELLELLRTVE
ncbi:hypothetical protein SAMN04487948_101249 [Halogranum amylolyticum]|uniref:Uncharacterized protein n=1 Tax=Halogranum amylolyticum TaxID=660520 RepID=A0A1H8N1J5_9EURY|nr:hypothetical protein [Halogranum amylolyticum]SEO23505.1 hypothetical protein SAMN04487948_101249 [Halogranum amylolyticum]